MTARYRGAPPPGHGWQPGAVTRGRYSDLDRPPLPVAASWRPALAPDGFELTVLERRDSTNAVVAERARAGAPEGTVVVAELQTAGRGPAGPQLDVAAARRAHLQRAAAPAAVLGVAAAAGRAGRAVAVREQAGVEAGVKWPNDVLVEDREGRAAEGKSRGCWPRCRRAARARRHRHRAERHDARSTSCRTSGATSLALAGAGTTDRATLLKAILRSLGRAYASWRR